MRSLKERFVCWKTLMRRMVVSGNKPERIWAHVLQFAGCIRFEKVHPLQGGYLRRKLREAAEAEPLETVRGFGYRYNPGGA